jgi:tetratricopeptide (TPR) repeat protein
MSRIFRAFVSALGVVVSASPVFAKENPAIAVMPFEGVERPVGDAGYAAALRVLGALEARRDVNVLHFKQLNRAIEQHEQELATVAAAEKLKRIGVWLGATAVISGTLNETGKNVTINLVRTDANGKSKTVKIEGMPLLAALNAIPERVDQLVPRTEPASAEPIAPASSNVEALLEYAGCHEALIRQPIGIRDPVVLESSIVEDAIKRCESAAKLDANLLDARAALGLAYALKGDRAAAEKNLAAAKSSRAFLPLYWIGRFWILSRYYGADPAIDTLRRVIEEHPGFLLARGYLGDTLNTLGRHDDALEVFKAYLDAVPNQPWVMSRIGYTLAKQGKTKEAIDATKKALRSSPADSELLLEMASRYVDAGQAREAEVILRRVIATGSARGEVHLRLGYVYLMIGRYPEAERAMIAAIEKADRPSEWRTRGRARYDLAKLWMKNDVPDNALRQLRMAVEEGYLDTSRFEADADFQSLRNDARFKQLVASDGKAPQFVSPFPVNPKTGEATRNDAAASTQAIAF